jgi:hypothetical protein
MAKVTLMGREFDIAPYKIGQLRKAAPIIDRMNARVAGLASVSGMVEAAADMIDFLWIGLVRLDPTITLDQLNDEIGMGDLPAIRDAVLAVMTESGLKSGEAKAPVPAAPEASPTLSADSSTN